MEQAIERITSGFTSRPNESEYADALPVWEKLKDEAVYIVEGLLNASDVKIHSLVSRIKTCKSFADKAERKSMTDPVNQMRDVVGLRIVCLFLSDVERVGKLVENGFEIVEQDNKIDGGNVSSFG
jgi:ppGpp synthetase/RelA/SpoT-type nucleotidyltranferase